MAEKKQFDFTVNWTDRKLKNIDSELVLESILEKLKTRSKPSIQKLIIKTQTLIANKLCDGYQYTKDDFLLIKEGLRTYCSILTIEERKLIERFEEVNNIKSVWRSKSEVTNIRGQHFKIKMNE